MDTIFRLSFPVSDFDQARRFYGGVLGCKLGRLDSEKMDFNFFGHHIVAQLSPEEASRRSVGVGKERYPLRHFGAIVFKAEFERIAQKLQDTGARFVIRPEIRHTGTVREQHTLFVLDPFGNGVEFKALAEPQNVFKP